MFKPASKWDIGAIAQEKAARKRSSWSAFEPPTEEEITKVADLLGFAPEAMQIAASRGLLFCATCRDGHRSFVVADSRKLSAAAVRFDGLPWERTNRISRTLPGSMEGWPVGIDEASQFPAIALVCDGIDLLAALHLSWCVAREGIIAPVAIMPPAASIADIALPLFKGKAVCLFPHATKEGQQTGDTWGRQLLQTGIEPDTYSLDGWDAADSSPAITLHDFAHVDPDQWEEHRDTIEAAFNFGPAPIPPSEITLQQQEE
jgi:hypothetical protein